VLSEFSAEHHGLDFGAGTGPVISEVLRGRGYSVALYDPFFHHDPALLRLQYDYIVCCEVMEHFHDPGKEFNLLSSLLPSHGVVYCMTDLYEDNIDFKKWYYKNDPTHVFIYSAATCQWVAKHCGFSDCSIRGRLVRFTRR
jgi:hypothetical protein